MSNYLQPVRVPKLQGFPSQVRYDYHPVKSLTKLVAKEAALLYTGHRILQFFKPMEAPVVMSEETTEPMTGSYEYEYVFYKNAIDLVVEVVKSLTYYVDTRQDMSTELREKTEYLIKVMQEALKAGEANGN